ncbi:enoyl-CoA hydratase/isomerase family protein [Sphingomonas aerophila]|uniref:3-hydroxyisobutyryl-CoA hydrolase n=1 Tax=Sphingomonas aerophila TaxID=1344948 RepID=A0A7W9EUK3_9SPHN|nr:enoyl-CoA hydratase/isomerase family protein [Sphingomonas aerophila]MBB5715265.1 enoyl-CoA hydratase [Sphingomonas aerophila]
MQGELVAEVQGRVGRVRLNRPRQLHALNTAMCEGMLQALDTWRKDDDVEAVVIDHLPAPDGDPKLSRGFCAGGDIRMLADSGATDGVAARAFFFTEYRLNHRLFTYAKPTVAFMDGVTMGGGVGISQPCRFRVATQNTKLAMPETAIGLFPDVGGGWYLSRLPGRVGQYLALTGHRLDGAECLALGLATHFLPIEHLDEAKQAIAPDPQHIAATLDHFSASAPDAAILSQREAIDRLFASDRLEDVFAALEADESDFARQTLEALRTRSPQAMKISLKLLLESVSVGTFEDEMAMEYAVATRVVQRQDFAEGVRAVIVDKDNAPRWSAATPDAVSDHLIDQIFAPLPASDAWSPE